MGRRKREGQEEAAEERAGVRRRGTGKRERAGVRGRGRRRQKMKGQAKRKKNGQA